MPIDASIPLQVQTPNIANIYSQALGIKGAMQEQQARSIAIAQAMQAQKDQLDLRNAYAANPDPNMAIAALKSSNPYVANQEQARITKLQQEQAKTQGDITKTDLANHAAKAQRFASLLSTANPQNYGQVLNQAVSEGVITPQEIHTHGLDAYDPTKVQQTMQSSVSFADQVKNKLQQDRAAEIARHNQQTETTAAATQAETAKYHGIEAKQRQQQIGIEEGQLGVARQRLGNESEATIEQQAQQIANGEVKPLSQSRNNPFARSVMARVYEINPNYSDSLYTMTQALRSDKPNSMGANVGRLGTAVLHADNALRNSNDLGFSEGLLTGIGTEKTAPYKQDAEFLTGEIGQFVTGGKLTVDEGSKLSKDLMSSRQRVRDSAIHEILDLAGGKLKSQMQQYKNATKSEFPTDRVFNDPAIIGALQKHGIIGGASPSAPASPVATHRYNPATGQIEAIK